MAGRPPEVFLHVGAMKTGTSYLQQLLGENAQQLAADGVLFPGDTAWGAQVRAVRDILQLGADRQQRDAVVGAWGELRRQLREHDGRAALISMEFLSFASRKRAQALVLDLAPADVSVIVTIRDAGRVLPAQWQESTQNRGTASWERYTEAVLRGKSKDPIWRTSMRALNIPNVLNVWGALIPPERLHLVTVPPPGSAPTLLWERFAAAVGLDPQRYEPPKRRRNESLGYASADLMRRANVDLRSLPIAHYQQTVKAHLCKRVLAGRSGEPRVGISPALSDFATQWNNSMVDAVTKSGGVVHGDLSDLLLPTPVTKESVEEPAPAELLSAASDALAGLKPFIDVRRRKLEKLQNSMGTEDTVDSVPATPRPDPADDVGAAVAEVVAAVRLAIDLQQRYRTLAGLDDDQPSAESRLSTTVQRATRRGRRVLRRLLP